MENDSSTKSIIYGNIFQNKYAKFMPICASILDRSSIASILQYLKDTPHFKKFNRVAYAYRVDEMPIVFITQKKNVETQYYEGCHSDETIEGSGQKLLHLLQKFNIRNVLIAVLVQQFHPLMPFECVNYRAIIENSRLLLDELYRKVLQFQDSQNNQKQTNDLLLSGQKTLKTKKIDLTEEFQVPISQKPVIKEHPNHIYSGQKPNFLSQTKKATMPNQQELSFLWQRCRVMKQEFKKISGSLTAHELQELKYFMMYDKNRLINLVIELFGIYVGMSKDQLIVQFDFKSLRDLQLEMLPVDKLRKLDGLLKSNRKIVVDSVLKVNCALGMVFSMLQISVRYSKSLERITSIVEKGDNKTQSLIKSDEPVVKIYAVI